MFNIQHIRNNNVNNTYGIFYQPSSSIIKILHCTVHTQICVRQFNGNDENFQYFFAYLNVKNCIKYIFSIRSEYDVFAKFIYKSS